jgi:hypothetical protein
MMDVGALRVAGGGRVDTVGTEFYYRNLVRAHAAANCSLELIIAHADIRDLVQNNEGSVRTFM